MVVFWRTRPLASQPLWLALLHVGLYSFGEVVTGVNARKCIIEGDLLFRGPDVPVGLFGGPDGERSQRTDLLCNLVDMGQEVFLIDNSCEEATLECLFR